MRGLVDTLEKHHKVRILDEAVSEAVRLSARYIPSRQLPDKAVSLIDTACARVGMSQAAMPPPIEDRQRRIALIDTEVGDPRPRDRRRRTDTRRAARTCWRSARRVAQELADLEARWEQEKALAAEIGDTRAQDRGSGETRDGQGRAARRKLDRRRRRSCATCRASSR